MPAAATSQRAADLAGFMPVDGRRTRQFTSFHYRNGSMPPLQPPLVGSGRLMGLFAGFEKAPRATPALRRFVVPVSHYSRALQGG